MAAYRYIACRMCRIFCDGEICSVDFIKAHQLNIMLFMSGICGILALLSCLSKVIIPKRRRILTILEAAGMIC